MKTNYPIGSEVRILNSPANYAKNKTGTITGKLEGGYAVEIEAHRPLSGAVPGSQSGKVTVWADEVEPVDHPILAQERPQASEAMAIEPS